jgi:hypothetical protein
MPVQPQFEVSAFVPGDADAMNGKASPWCDLILDVEQEGSGKRRMELTRAAGEAIIDAIHETIHPWAGKSSADTAWRELDFIMARLMDGEAADEDRGRAQGLAYGLACMMNPFAPDVDLIREQALERYESHAPQRELQRGTCEKFGHQVYAHRPDQCQACGHLMAEGDRINGQDAEDSPFG